MSNKPTKAPKSRNILLQKVIVGKGRLPTHTLPGQDHIYGRKTIRDPLDDFGYYRINFSYPG
jgi:Domain of unknown function (DUF4483)